MSSRTAVGIEQRSYAGHERTPTVGVDTSEKILSGFDIDTSVGNFNLMDTVMPLLAA